MYRKTDKIKVERLSLNKKVNPYKACIYRLCRDFLDDVGYDLGTKSFVFRHDFSNQHDNYFF